MKKVFTFAVLLIITIGLLSCSGGGNKTITDPEELGEAIGKNYDEMMDKVVALLESTDDLDKLKQDLAVLKEEYITIFVEFGKMREQMKGVGNDRDGARSYAQKHFDYKKRQSGKNRYPSC